MRPVIRRAGIEDYAGVCRLLDQLDAEHRERLPWLFKAPESQPRSAELIGGWINGSDSVVFVAESDGIVGVVIGLARTSPDFPSSFNRPTAFSTASSSTWHGGDAALARLLTQAIEVWALDRGLPWVELGVYDFNAEARGFYEALGYVPLRAILGKPTPPRTAT